MVLHDLAYLHYPEFLQKDSLLYFRKRTPVFLEMAGSVATVSEYVKEDIISNFDVNPAKVIVAYNSVNPDKWEFNTLVKTPDVPYFLYVGAIHPRKNVKNLIEAFLSFKKDYPGNTRLILIGRMAWDTNEVEQLIQQHQDIQYLGPLPEADKNIWIKNALCMTYVSVFEGFGIPLLEAFAMGVPVITSNVTSMPEVAGEAALCVNPFSREDIAQAMAKVYSDETLRSQLIREGYHRVNEFSWPKTASALYDELKKIAF
jgi:glycosyltransferase involved in cell wall biosynthesis